MHPRRSTQFVTGLCLSVLLSLGNIAGARVSEGYGKLPMHFEANQGQTDNQVRFLSRGGGYTLFLTSTQAVLALGKPQGNAAAAGEEPFTPAPPQTKELDHTILRMWFVGGDPSPGITGIGQLPGSVNYFIGNDPSKWRANVPTYAGVRYKDVYPGIDVAFYGNERQLEYDFIVPPGSDPKTITLAFEGVDKLEVDGQGDLVLHMGGGEIRQHKPLVYQEVDGVRQEIQGGYVTKDKYQVGFELGAYDATTPLVIDPVLVYSTYLGGNEVFDPWGESGDVGEDIAVDAHGNAYVTGQTSSTDFPTLNALQPALAGDSDVFVAKLNPEGSALVYCTYLGGTEEWVERGTIAVDADGNAYVAGTTSSADFPTLNALQPALAGDSDAFVAKLGPTGALVYSTYLGGSADEHPGDNDSIAVDADGNAYVAGGTSSGDFPTTENALKPPFVGDHFVAKLNPEGSALVYSTYFCGGSGIALDADGDVYVMGGSDSPDLPTVNALQPDYAGGTQDLYAAKLRLNPEGSEVVYATYLGGSGYDEFTGMAVDDEGNAYVTGNTSSRDFPRVNALQPDYAGGISDIFVAKLNPQGSALVYSTYLGGSCYDEGGGIDVDNEGNAYVTGGTSSRDFPTVRAFQPDHGCQHDIFVAKLDAEGSTLLYSSYLGGCEGEQGTGIAVDASGNAYVTGPTSSADFPTVNALQPALRGHEDVFIAKIADPPGTTTTTTTSATTTTTTLLNQCQVDHSQCRQDRDQCEVDLAVCNERKDCPQQTDGDADGKLEDGTDKCLGTVPGHEVDADGCSLAQYCSKVDPRTKQGKKTCTKADWKNDEPLMNKGEQDCRIDKGGKGREDDRCVPR